MKDGIPTTVIADNMAGAMMKQGKIGAIVVGADFSEAKGLNTELIKYLKAKGATGL